MKVAFWENSPTPHQSDFYAALRRRNLDVRVVYVEPVPEARRKLGWAEPTRLPPGESRLAEARNPLGACADWRERIHIIPGYSRRVHRSLVVQLSRAGVPWVHWSERSRPLWRAVATWTIKRWYAGWVNRTALGAFAQGEAAVRDFQRWRIRPEKIAHLYYAVNGVPVGTQPDTLTAEFVGAKPAFIYAGRLTSAKGCDDLMRAFAKICGDTNAVLIVVGDGPRANTYREFVRERGIADRVLFRGRLSPEDVGSVLLCCQTLVLPSHYDGWGMVLNEGASAGLALIGTDRAGAAYHVIRPGWNGARVPAQDVTALAAAMREHAVDRALVALRGRRSRELFQNFTPATNAERFVNTICRWLERDDRWNSWPGYKHWNESAPAIEHRAAA